MRRKMKSGAISLGIYEVYYDEQNRPSSWTQEPITPMEFHDDHEDEKEMLKAFKKDFSNMKKAFDAPILDHGEEE